MLIRIITFFISLHVSLLAFPQNNVEEQRIERGYQKYLEGKFREAIYEFDQVTKSLKTNAEVYYLRGVCRSALGEEVLALEDFNEAIKIRPGYKEAFFERAYSKHNLEDFEGALEDYTTAIEIDPYYAAAYFNRGTLLYELDRDDEACKDWITAMQMDFPVADQLVERYCSQCKQ
jgi:tetratricopeptide (TPR) repeat protein